MPDPMKNTDIEDVLSSIRRLVSYEPANARPAEPVPPKQPDRLVLTPALRVNVGEDPAPEAADEGTSARVVPAEFIHRAEPAVSKVPAPGQSLEDRIADLEAAVSQACEDWEPDGSEAGANDYPTSYPAIEPQHRPRMHLAEPEAARARASEPAPAAVEPVVDAAEDAVAPEAIEQVALDAGADDLAARAETTAMAAAASMPPGNVDHEHLREVVRQIIREEFQGALGERITRNVRKLVRREINRALVSKDFE